MPCGSTGEAALVRLGWLQDELRAPLWPASQATASALLAAAAAATDPPVSRR